MLKFGIYTFAYLAVALVGTADELKLVTGDSIIEYDTVTYALHVPKSVDEPHGPFAILVFFGGYGDSIEYYQKALASLSDDLDIIAVIPQMPWFAKPGKASNAAVMGSLEGLRKELEARFFTDPDFIIVSGASAGGSSACQLTRRWGANVPLLVLHSTNRCSGIGRTRSVLLVGETEANFLGSETENGKSLGRGLTDLFAVPKEQHEVHFRHMRAWLETELAAIRVERSRATLQQAEQYKSQSAALLHSTLKAVQSLSTQLTESDDFMKYQNVRRKELQKRFQPQIEAIQKAQSPSK